MLLVSDGETTVVNGNDCKLDGTIEAEIKAIHPDGIDVYMGQFSGAAWHPMCYAGDGVFDEAHVKKLAAAHQTKTRDRFLRVCQSLGARKWVPCSGPACFLEEELFQYNALDAESQSLAIFPDAYQCGFPEVPELCRVMPGDAFTSQSLHDTPVDPIVDKRAYLEARKVRTKRVVSAAAIQKAADGFERHVGKLLARFGPFLSKRTPSTGQMVALVLGPRFSCWALESATAGCCCRCGVDVL